MTDKTIEGTVSGMAQCLHSGGKMTNMILLSILVVLFLIWAEL